jgi:pimeloyl-ACP methyl ester carboxylesterase
MTTLDGFSVPVAVAGPEKGVVVLLVGDEQRSPLAYDALCQRLHTAALRTVVIGYDRRLTAKSVVGILDGLGIGWAVVVGDRAGGEMAWELAATKLGRFVGLVVIDRGHPRAANLEGVVVDEHCPPVEVGTTVLVSSPAAREVAGNSERFVYSDYRVVDLDRRATAQLAAEIVLRASSW